MAAALCGNLVFDMATASTGPSHFAYRPPDHERTAPAGVRVHQQRHIGGITDPPNVPADIGQGRHCQVGQAERGIGHTGAGQINRLEAGAFCLQCAIGIDRADDLKWSLVFQGLPQPCACAHRNSSLVRNLILIRALVLIRTFGPD